MSENKEETTSGETALVSLLLTPLGWYLYGLVIHKTWKWLIATNFEVPQLPVTACIGVILIRYAIYKRNQPKNIDVFEIFDCYVMYPLLLLSIAFVTSLFV